MTTNKDTTNTKQNSGMNKLRVRTDLERMVLNYSAMGDISEDQSSEICDCLNRIIGGGEWIQPRKAPDNSIIQFPTTYTGAPAQKTIQKEKEKPPEYNAPYGSPLPEDIEDLREILQRPGLVLICWNKLESKEGVFFDVLWAQSNNPNRERCTEWSGLHREEELPYVMPRDYKYVSREYENKTFIHTVNVAPENILKGPVRYFFEYISHLENTGFKNDFGYVFNFAAEKRKRFLEKNRELVELKLPPRVITRLSDRDIHTRKALKSLTVQELQAIKGIGKTTLEETLSQLSKAGITLQEGELTTA